ncbi:MAG: helix-turn-helix family protein [Herbinix sp.]|jgi:LacI family transcriptional regulator|nr:helix-turn-helix family protein [Herbinix sp.]
MKTINDVAQLAGVSVATVSKVFNGRKGVSEETRQRIIEIAEELDYFPNHSASQLARGKRETIGVVFSLLESKTLQDEYLIRIINGIFNKAELLGYRILVFTTNTVERNNQNFLQFCRSNNLAGLIIHGLDRDDPQLEKLINSEIPCVFIDINISGTKTTNISVDNVTACIDVVNILTGLNHQHIAFVSGNLHSSVALDRLKGYEIGMKAMNWPLHVIECDYSKENAYKLSKDYLLYHPEITAFFCASDLMAVGVLDACIELGYKVPEDMSIIGFDNLSFTQHIKPQLSTVAQNFYEIGNQAVDLLEDITKGKKIEDHNYVPYHIEMRKSTSRNHRI